MTRRVFHPMTYFGSFTLWEVTHLWTASAIPPKSSYGNFARRPLPPCHQPTDWVEIKGGDISNFKGEGIPAPEFQSGFCTTLKDDISVGQESILASLWLQPSSRTWLATILWKDSLTADFRHFMTVSRDTRLIYWVCDCLIVSILKMNGIYKTI